jgi:hypothetical protein
MAKQTKTNRSDAAEAGRARSIILHSTLAALLLAGGGYGFYKLREHVVADLSYPSETPRVVLNNPPAWMSDALAEQIVRSAQPTAKRSALDQGLLKEVSDILEQNPWVRQVKQIRRVYGQSAGDTIEADCEYRAPIALVAGRNEYILVDGEGVRLPEHFSNKQTPPIVFTREGRVNIRIIEGVAAAPPRDGQKWAGEDLAAGLDLAKMLFGKDCAEEVHRLNVSNFKGRRNAREAQIVLITKNQTEIRWGEPVKMTFHSELSPAEKLSRLELVRKRFGRVDGGYSWIDIRMDKITYPADEAPIVQANNGTGGRD